MSRTVSTRPELKALPNPFVPLTGGNLLQRKCDCGQHTIAGGECKECNQKRDPTLQRSTKNHETVNDSQGVRAIANDPLRSARDALNDRSRAYFETRLGHDFSRVKVRTEGKLPAFRPSRRDSRLAAQTPAWSDNGEIHVGAAGLLMPTRERDQMLRHEMVHAFHQRLAVVSNHAESQRHAEALAMRGEHHNDGLAFTDFLKPVPTLLAYPPQTYGPWSKVWIGHTGVLGEVVEAGVTVRIFMKYDDLGIKKRPESQAYECGKHDLVPIPDVVKKMKKAAQIAAGINKSLPTTAVAQRVALIAIFGGSAENAYRTAGGQGLIVLARDDFDAGTFDSTVAHESSHAIFEFHSVAGNTDASARVPNPLALRIADLYQRLSATKPVPIPTARFDKKSPPALTADKDTSSRAAGIVMVTDTLWSGSGGHSWDGVDEFFASAYAGFLRQRTLLANIVEFYEKHDPAIRPLATELIGLLATVDQPQKYRAVERPKQPQAAQATLDAVSPPVEFTKTHRSAGWFIDPSTMPSPDKINCSAGLVSDEDIDKMLKGNSQPGEKPPKQPDSGPKQ
jgi:hypothetical protein